MDVVVGETDHSSYAILYYQKGRSISLKLYGGSVLGGLWRMKDRGGRGVGTHDGLRGCPSEPRQTQSQRSGSWSPDGEFCPQTLCEGGGR